MMDDKEVSLTIHGLPVDNGNVRADVFLEKFRSLVSSIKLADGHLNGQPSHQLVIVGLAIGSATAQVRERLRRRSAVAVDSAPFVGDALRCIYNGDASLDRFPPRIIESLVPLVKGVDKKFSHAELEFGSGIVIRIDDYFAGQMDRAIKKIRGIPEIEDINFHGIAYGVFDGILKEIDSRGILVRGKLILTAGGNEVDCIFSRDEIPHLRENFEKRARISAVAHYDGINLLPARLDVRQIEPVSQFPDLARWRGALHGTRPRHVDGL